MATTFLNARIWPRLTKLARDSRQQCHVAVAYFGQGASKLLPLPAGSILVVDMSEGSVKEGQTSPTEVGNMLRRKVAVYSCRGLHAKAFVFGKTAVVGSANVSARSKNILIEAAIETTEPKTVRSCVQFVRDWCRKRITKRDVERLAPLYNPAGGRGGKYLGSGFVSYGLGSGGHETSRQGATACQEGDRGSSAISPGGVLLAWE